MEYPKKLTMELPSDPAIPLLGIYPKKPETLIRKSISTHMFTAVLFTIVKIWKQSKCPSADEWIKELWYISIMEYYSAKKRNLNLYNIMNGPAEDYAK